MSKMRSLPGAQVPISQLRLKLHRTSAELKSKGTIEDPIGSQPGWSMDRLDSFGGRLRPHEGTTLGALRENKLDQAEQLSENSSQWVKSVLGAGAVGAGVVLAAPLVGPVLAAAAGAATVGFATVAAGKVLHNSLLRSEVLHAVADLETWGKAFESQGILAGS